MPFTPVESLAGGLLIGASVSLLHLANRDIAGISGILGRLFSRPWAEWPVLFLVGLPLGGSVYAAAAGGPPVAEIAATTPVLLAAGLLVGFGTRWANGCTSGHGICGLARFSLRSLVATLVFMVAGAATVYVARQVGS